MRGASGGNEPPAGGSSVRELEHPTVAGRPAEACWELCTLVPDQPGGQINRSLESDGVIPFRKTGAPVLGTAIFRNCEPAYTDVVAFSNQSKQIEQGLFGSSQVGSMKICEMFEMAASRHKESKTTTLVVERPAENQQPKRKTRTRRASL